MSRLVANDDGLVTLAEAEALVSEIERLRTSLVKVEAKLGHLDQLAHQDSLVGLPNRRSFIAKLEQAIGRVERQHHPAAVLFIDVDGLKSINDTFGHKAGDAALVEIAQLLVASVRSTDCVARIGGDEFGILLEQLDEQRAWLMALRVVEKVVGSQLCVDGTCLRLSVAVGVGMIASGDTPPTVLDRADREMYRIKSG